MLSEEIRNPAPAPAQPPSRARVVIEIDLTSGSVSWAVEGPFPTPHLAMTLDLIKAQIVAEQLEILARAKKKSSIIVPRGPLS